MDSRLVHLSAGLIKLNSVVVQTVTVFTQMVTYMTDFKNNNVNVPDQTLTCSRFEQFGHSDKIKYH